MKNQKSIPLFAALREHANKKPTSFHVPGHKNGSVVHFEAIEFFQKILQLDATELSGLDDLHSPEGVIKEAEVLLASLYHVKQSFFLVNGSTVGNLAMVMAACEENDVVLVQRNCHKSVLNALRLAKVQPVFLEPEYDPEWKVATGISVKTTKDAIAKFPDAKAIILTYPNYYGMVSDLKGVIDQAHQHNIAVLVDEAHGPHFTLGRPFPPSAIELGADMAVHSAHKTLPAMTMGSYLHVNSDRININKVKDYLQMFQSSSPSYPIMASLDLARSYLATYEQKDIHFLFEKIKRFRAELADIPCLKVLEYPNEQGDLLKITVQSRGEFSGFELQQRLEKIGIYSELADPYNVLFIFPLLKENQNDRFEETAAKIKGSLKGLPFHSKKDEVQMNEKQISQLAVPYKKMEDYEEKVVPIVKAIGSVCAETIIPYPPGIPLLLKGEQITEGKIIQLNKLIGNGARFQGGSNLDKGLIKIFWTTR